MAAKSVLFVLGALGMGGVETYIVRMSRELAAQGGRVEILLLSKKIDDGLRRGLEGVANITVFEKYPYLTASSWLNGMSLLDRQMGPYDIVHVVDLLTLGFVYFNRDRIRFDFLSIGIYHSAEFEWWRERGVYFRDCHLNIFERNIDLNLFPNEVAAQLAGCKIDQGAVLPLGVDLEKYRDVRPGFLSKKIVSVGRLVAFKKYNRHVISSLAELRSSGDYQYFVYGNGPELGALRRLAEYHGVARFVHFEGSVDYHMLPEIFNGSFCFVGSGTSIIEASASGVPAVVGIESLDDPVTCGYFSDLVGYSYNEAVATDVRLPIVEVIKSLSCLSEDDYKALSGRHREKAANFDIKMTSKLFVELSGKAPDFSMNFSRRRSLISFFGALLRFGPTALKKRFDQAVLW